MKPLSKDTEAKLVTAVEKTAALVNAGQQPNDAIVKVATEMSLPAGHVGLVVHAYNTGRTAQQRNAGDNPLEKAADFDMANADQILERLYPGTVKTAAAVAREQAVSFEYAVPPTGMLQRREKRARRAETVDWKMCDPPPPRPGDPVTRVKRAYNRHVENNKQIDEARRLASASYDKSAAMLDDVVTYLRTPGHLPYGDAKLEVTRRFGAIGTSIMEKAAALWPRATKEAATGQLAPPKDRIYDLVGGLIDELTRHNQLKVAYEKTAAARRQDSETTLRPFVQPLSRSILEDSSEKQAASPFAWGVTGGMTKDLLDGVAKKISPPDDSKLLQHSLSQLTDPQHEAELRNIRTQAMLQDLMTNDDVIKGYEPDDVLTAFNEIGEVAPRAIDQRLIMQTLLRKRLAQGQLDPYEVDQLLSMEGKLKSRNEVPDVRSFA